MSAPDRKHDWIEYKTLAVRAAQPSPVSVSPRTELRRPWAGRGHTGDTQGQRRSMRVPGSPAAVPGGACVSERVRKEPWGGDTRPGTGTGCRGSCPRSPPPQPRLVPAGSARSGALREGRAGGCAPPGLGEGTGKSRRSNSLQLFPSSNLASLPLLPLPPSPLSPPSLFLIPATSSEPHSAAAAAGV